MRLTIDEVAQQCRRDFSGQCDFALDLGSGVLGLLGPAVLGLEQEIQLSREMGDYSEQQADPALMVPFLLYSLPSEERASMGQTMPPVVLQGLMPVVWQEESVLMEPFLLEWALIWSHFAKLPRHGCLRKIGERVSA